MSHDGPYGAIHIWQVRVHDHDCPWVSGAIGGNNHISFLLMLLLGEAAVLSWAACTYLRCAPPAAVCSCALAEASSSSLTSGALPCLSLSWILDALTPSRVTRVYTVTHEASSALAAARLALVGLPLMVSI